MRLFLRISCSAGRLNTSVSKRSDHHIQNSNQPKSSPSPHKSQNFCSQRLLRGHQANFKTVSPTFAEVPKRLRKPHVHARILWTGIYFGHMFVFWATILNRLIEWPLMDICILGFRTWLVWDARILITQELLGKYKKIKKYNPQLNDFA